MYERRAEMSALIPLLIVHARIVRWFSREIFGRPHREHENIVLLFHVQRTELHQTPLCCISQHPSPLPTHPHLLHNFV
jgi:hypothetical protein